jgi:hypothetical protein
MQEVTVSEARAMLSKWAKDQAAVLRRRDEVVRTAVASGLTKAEVSRLAAIARTTVDRILAPACDGPETAQEAK